MHILIHKDNLSKDLGTLNQQLHLYSHRLKTSDQAGNGLTMSNSTSTASNFPRNINPHSNFVSQDNGITIADEGGQEPKYKGTSHQ